MPHAGPPPARNVLPVPRVRARGVRVKVPLIAQEGDHLCWAACMEMMTKVRPAVGAWTQCRIVEDTTRRAPGHCCSAPSATHISCDHPCGPLDVEGRYAKIGMNGVNRQFVARTGTTTTGLRAQVEAELNQKRPVQIGWHRDGSQHFVLLVGYRDGARGWRGVVNDPTWNRKRTTMSWDDLLEIRNASVAMQTWTWTWTHL